MNSTFARKHSRRTFCLCCVSAATLGVTSGMMTPGRAFATARGIVDLIKDDAVTAPINIYRLRGGMSVLEGSGGNIGVLTGPHGKVLVDAGIAVSRPQMQKAFASIGPEPVTHLINTHWHFDHADGNSWLATLGPKIIAHENARKHLSKTQRVEDWSYDFAPLPPAALPTELFRTEYALRAAGTQIELSYYGQAHTDSDIGVAFPEHDVLHAGDTFWNGSYPFIDYSTGGSIDGSIRAAEANLRATTDNTIIIPGHGWPVSNRREMQAFRDMLVAIRDNVSALKQKGLPFDEIVAAKPTAAFDAKWGQFVVGPALFTKLVHEGV